MRGALDRESNEEPLKAAAAPADTDRNENRMTETLVDLIRTLEPRSQEGVFRCPDCGSFLDAPRINPLTGDLGRKCVACREWIAVEPDLAPDRY
jgi:hypothetical protein